MRKNGFRTSWNSSTRCCTVKEREAIPPFQVCLLHPEFTVKTIEIALHDETVPADLVRPGHIFPLAARDGGVFTRTGHTEVATDLARLAGFKPAGIIVEIIKPDGSMARQPDLFEFKKQFKLPYITISDLIEYRLKYDKNLLESVPVR